MLSQALSKRLLLIKRSPLLFTSVRFFAAAPVPEPLSISQLNELGQKNLAQTKVFDYAAIAMPNVHGLTNKGATFRSFEDQVNSQF